MDERWILAVLVVVILWQFTWGGMMYFFTECLLAVIILKRLFITTVELKETKIYVLKTERFLLERDKKILSQKSIIGHQDKTIARAMVRVAELEGILREECASHKVTQESLQQSDAKFCQTNALLEKTQNEIIKLRSEYQRSVNNLEEQLSEKHDEISNAKTELSEAQMKLEVKQSEFETLKKVTDIQLAQMNTDLSLKTDRLIDTQTRLALTTESLKTAEKTVSMAEAALRLSRSKFFKEQTKTSEAQRKLTEAEKNLEDMSSEQLKSRENEARLITELSETMERLGALQKRTCVICMESETNSALIPCGHTSTCYDCSLRLHRRDHAKCPVCRDSITQILRIYL